MKKFIIAVISVILITSIVGCVKTSKTTMEEVKKTETNHARLVERQPPPMLDVSLERTNLINRLERLNREDMVSYIYLISYGKIMANYTVKGKVSSLNSLLTTPEQPIVARESVATIPSPDFDGSYGKNADGIFFFTTEEAYVEWAGDYLWSDQPLKISQPPELVVDMTKKLGPK
jgi:hypothetical protein